MLISHIVAISKNHVIGKNNQLPWHLPADTKYFRDKTLGHVVIMGRKNYEAEGKPLKDRTNIIITRNKNFQAENCLIARSLNQAISIAKPIEKEEIFIIGGGQVYKESLSVVDRLYVTIIDIEIEGDVYYPKIDLNIWKPVSKRNYLADQSNHYNHTYYIFERK